ncbi:hypothetical protein AKJ51_02265 [candidate division MSBL1 archaeon SCGC-AAA382A20]|uniref:Uncharacterized protein n=1 Tax=candidate division MSBL1 archaeon SCGC-AAA382A20 TaxID=1698280 RepID=A0A133VKN8_9EURY|nr:hypothetical protein AKJ51_02265 [candidate division MSBL1 archaeon SCGC-AAA382A20]
MAKDTGLSIPKGLKPEKVYERRKPVTRVRLPAGALYGLSRFWCYLEIEISNLENPETFSFRS